MSNVTIEPSEKGSDYWLARPYLREETRDKLRGAGALLVPQEGFRGEEVRTFPVRTEDFYGYLKENLKADGPVDLAIEDADYKELAMHSSLIVLGTLLVKFVLAPIAVKVVSDYIGKRLQGEAKKEAATVRFEMIVQEETAQGIRAMKISYDGPALDFLPAMQSAVEKPPTVILGAVVAKEPAKFPAPAEKKPDAQS